METVLSSIKFGQLVYPAKLTSTLPLKETTVSCQITGLSAQIRVTQLFTNPMAEPAELEYLFPLPHQAALVDFEIKIGERSIKAELQELEQAQKAYDQASQNGQHAALLEQHRPNLFAIRLANVLPGELIQAAISYEERLSLRDGEVEFIFPMGLTPRYTSPSAPEEGEGVNPPVALSGEPVGPVEIADHPRPGCGGRPTAQPQPSYPGRKEGRSTAGRFSSPLPPFRIMILFCEFLRLEKTWNWLPGPAGMQPAKPSLSAGCPQRRSRPALFPNLATLYLWSTAPAPCLASRSARRATPCGPACASSNPVIVSGSCCLMTAWIGTGLEPLKSLNLRSNRRMPFLNSVEGRGGTEIIPAIEAALSTPVAEGKLRYYPVFDGWSRLSRRKSAQHPQEKGPPGTHLHFWNWSHRSIAPYSPIWPELGGAPRNSSNWMRISKAQSFASRTKLPSPC